MAIGTIRIADLDALKQAVAVAQTRQVRTLLEIPISPLGPSASLTGRECQPLVWEVCHSAIEVTITIYAHVSPDQKHKASPKLGSGR
jgi:hypothetical protein